MNWQKTTDRWIKRLSFALFTLCLSDLTFAQVAVPYLSTNQSHLNPVGAVWRDTGHTRFSLFNGSGDVKRSGQMVSGSLIGESAGGEVDILLNESTEATKGNKFDQKGLFALRGAFTLGESFAIGYSIANFGQDTAERYSKDTYNSSTFGLGLKLNNFYLGYAAKDAKQGDKDYANAALGAGGIFGSPQDLQWKFEYAIVSSGRKNFGYSLTTIEARVNEWVLGLQQDNGNLYDKQKFHLGWENPDSWAFTGEMYSITGKGFDESGFIIAIGYNLKNMNRQEGATPAQAQEEQPSPEQGTPPQ